MPRADFGPYDPILVHTGPRRNETTENMLNRAVRKHFKSGRTAPVRPDLKGFGVEIHAQGGFWTIRSDLVHMGSRRSEMTQNI